MPETAKEYTQRLFSYVGKDDPLKIMRSTIDRLQKYLMKTEGRRKQTGDQWNISDLFSHFAEGELVYGYRIRAIARDSGCSIQGYDQNVWVADSEYLRKNPKMAFDLFRSLRLANIAYLKSLTADQWERYGIHSERGRESVRHLTKMIAGHDRNHLRQVERLTKQ
jgi:DinB family protein